MARVNKTKGTVRPLCSCGHPVTKKKNGNKVKWSNKCVVCTTWAKLAKLNG